MLHLRTCLLLAAAVCAGTVAHAQIEVRVPADGDAVANPRPVWLRVEDVKGSYTIPHIQSSDLLRVTVTFASERVVEAEVGLAGGDRVRRAAQTATKTGDVVEFTGLPPGEYALTVTGRDAAGKVVARDSHGPVGIGTVIAALGDSITEGYFSRGFQQESLDLTPAMFPPEAVSRDRRNYPHFAPTTAHHRPDINCFTSWMPRLNDLLATKWRQPVFIANEGWGGITSGRYLQMIKTDAGWQQRMRQLEPSVWLIHLGVNDGRAKLAADEVTGNLASIVDILVQDYAATPARIFVATPSYDYAPGAADRLATYRTAIGKLVAEKGLSSGPDFFAAYADDRPRYYGTDPVHPNAEGMELMARLWAKALPVKLPAAAAGRPAGKAAGVINTPLIFGDAWSFSFKGTMPHRMQGYTCTAPALKFDPRGRSGDFVDIAVRGREIEVKTAAPVSIITPPVFQPDATVDVEMTVSGRKDTVSVRADGEGRLALTTAPHDCLVHLPQR